MSMAGTPAEDDSGTAVAAAADSDDGGWRYRIANLEKGLGVIFISPLVSFFFFCSFSTPSPPSSIHGVLLSFPGAFHPFQAHHHFHPSLTVP